MSMHAAVLLFVLGSIFVGIIIQFVITLIKFVFVKAAGIPGYIFVTGILLPLIGFIIAMISYYW